MRRWPQSASCRLSPNESYLVIIFFSLCESSKVKRQARASGCHYYEDVGLSCSPRHNKSNLRNDKTARHSESQAAIAKTTGKGRAEGRTQRDRSIRPRAAANDSGVAV